MRVFPPADGPAGENSPFFFENRRQHGLAARDLTEKLVKTGGTPFLSTSLVILGQSAQTGEFLKVLKKSVTYPLGVSSEATRRVYLGTRDTVRTK